MNPDLTAADARQLVQEVHAVRDNDTLLEILDSIEKAALVGRVMLIFEKTEFKPGVKTALKAKGFIVNSIFESGEWTTTVSWQNELA